MLKQVIILLVCVSGIVASGCSTSGCTDNQNALPLAGFFSAESKTAITVKDVDVAGVGAPGDSILYKSGTSRSEIYLPFRANTNETSWYLHYTQEGIDDPALNDTIRFTYLSEPRFTSEDCGAMYFYRITKVGYTEHIVDSVAITDSLITNIDMMRIKIFLRTQAPDGDEEGGNEGEEEEEEEEQQ